MALKLHTYPAIQSKQENLLRALQEMRISNNQKNALKLVVASSEALKQGNGLSWEEIEEILVEVYSKNSD
jgi:hypothetical protein